jgi:spermidine/putrescine-binding protein
MSDRKDLFVQLRQGGRGRREALRMLGALGLAAVSLPVVARRARAQSDLLVFDWTGYEIPELHKPYIDKYGASPEIAIYADDEEAYVKIKGGFQADLVHPTSYAIGRYRDQGMLKPIDVTRLSNWPDILPEVASVKGFTTGDQRWFVPCGWGYNSVIYRSDIVEPKEDSWNLLWDERYAGRISNAVEMDGSVIPAAMVLGIPDPYDMNDEQLAQVQALLEKQRPLLRFYWTDPAELEQAIAAGEVVAAYAWAASASTLKSKGVPIAYMTPKEGVVVWIDGFIMLKDGPGKEQNAYDYIDAWLSPETGEYMLGTYGYAHSNRKSFERVSAERLKDIGITSPTELLARGMFLREMDPALRQKYIQMYENVRAGL